MINIELTSDRGLSGIGAPFFMKGLKTFAELETNSLAALSGREVGNVGLRDADCRSDLMLRQPRFHDVGDDVFPHDATNNSICCCTQQGQQQTLVQHLLSHDYAAHMKLEEVRRLRLRHWIDTDPVSMGDVEAWCSHYSEFVGEGENTLSPTYIRQLVPKRGHAARNIGERTARRLERIGSKPKGWLDDEEAASADGGAAPERAEEHEVTTRTARQVDSTEPQAAQTAAEKLFNPYALSVHLEALRQSARVIGAAFGLTTADVLAAAMRTPGNQAGKPDEDEDILDHGTFHGALGPEPPEYRPVMREESRYYSSQVDPYADLKNPDESQPLKKERRG